MVVVAILSAITTWFPLRLSRSIVVVRRRALGLTPGRSWRGGSLCSRHQRQECVGELQDEVGTGLGYLEGRRRTLLVRAVEVGWVVRDDEALWSCR
jgi:hypothetical protein